MKKNFLYLPLLASVLVLSQCKSSKHTKSAAATAPKPQAAAAKTPSIKEKTKNCYSREGLFTLYYDTTSGQTYLQLSKSQLGKEFIYFTYSENGVLASGYFRGQFRENSILRIEKEFDKIRFVKVNNNFYHDTTSAISRAAHANISEALIASEKIAGEDTSKGLYLVDASALFLSEKLHMIKPAPVSIPGYNPFDMGSLNKDKSRVITLRSYPKNTDLVVEYVFDNPMPRVGGGAEVTDPRSTSIVLQHTFVEMPQNNFKPRRDDPRVGYFMRAQTDLTSTSVTPYRDVISRWNLEKKNPNASLSEPVEPITYWIENTTPVEWRQTIKEAGLLWNKAFEKIGFKNAVRIEIQPDTATWDAGDIRYNVLRWTASPTPPFGGYGPSFVNPRTGQILGADIMLEYVYFANRLKQSQVWESFGIQNAQAEQELHALMGEHFCNAAEYMQLQNMFGGLTLNMADAGEDAHKKFMDQGLHYLILHEMGHTLGLMHNMKATQLHSPAQLADPSRISSQQLMASVMDYPATNIRKDKNLQTDYFINEPGPYDYWAIEYGYSVGLDDPAAEEKRLQKILERSTEPGHIFGNDGDDMRYPGKGMDPRVNIYDMSNDAVAYGEERTQMVKSMMKKLPEKYVKSGQSYQEFINAYLVLSNEHINAATAVSRYIGGVYVDRSFAGQQGGGDPFKPVAYKDQKNAMQYLGKYIFAPDAFKEDTELVKYMQVQRRGFNQVPIGEDPKIHTRILNIQASILAQLLNPSVLSRLNNTRYYGNEYSISEHFRDLTAAIFDSDINGNINGIRQNLQNYYVDELIEIAGLKGISAAFDHISQANALNTLKNIQKKLIAARGTGNEESKAHKEALILKLQHAFDGK